MKKIYIDGTGLTQKEIYGVQRYTYELLRELDRLVSPGKIVVLVPTNCERNLKFTNIFVKKINPFFCTTNRLTFWKTIGFGYYVKKHNGLAMDLSLNLSFWGADIVAIHDCIVEKCKQNCVTIKQKIKRLFFIFRVFINVKKSKQVITVSQYSKKEIADYYNIPKGKIKVIYSGWQHYDRINEDETILNKLDLKEKTYCFSLGSRFYHKNFKWIVEAAKQNPNYMFVVSGSNLFGRSDAELDKDKPNNVIFAGYLNDASVKALMRYCKVFILPSFYEGFGLPPLEAMSTGAKCIVSNTTSLPEIYDKSVWYIDPYNYKNINIDKIMNSKLMSKQYILKKYTWKKSANRLYKTLDLKFLNGFIS